MRPAVAKLALLNRAMARDRCMYSITVSTGSLPWSRPSVAACALGQTRQTMRPFRSRLERDRASRLRVRVRVS
jgi:hypothetical protein